MRGICPDCGLPLKGAQVCPACGAFDAGSTTSWVCFPCGAQNPHGAEQCECGRPRAIECSACSADIPFASETCPKCGVPRFAFEAAKEALQQTEEIHHRREQARSLALALLPLGAVGLVVLLLADQPALRLTGGGLVGLSLVGSGYALVTDRSARRRLQ